MPMNSCTSDQLDWTDIAPFVYRLHDYSLDPYMLRWLQLAWTALDVANLTRADTNVDALDTTIRAVCLVHFHNQFLTELVLSYRDDDFDGWLEGTVSAEQIMLVLNRKYVSCETGDIELQHGVRDAFEHIYWYHSQQIAGALLAHFGSVEGVFDSLIETATCTDASSFDICQLGAAYDFVHDALGPIGDPRVVDPPFEEQL